MALYIKLVKMFKFSGWIKQLQSTRSSKYHTVKEFPLMNMSNFRRGKSNRFGSNLVNFNSPYNAPMPWECNPIVSNSLRLEPPPPPPRIVTCGELRRIHEGKYVEMCGRFCNKRIGRFAELKDRFGVTQLVISEKTKPALARRLTNMPNDITLRIIGRVLCRPSSQRNESIPTGDIEVEIENILSTKMPIKHRIEQQQKRSYSTMVANKMCEVRSTECKVAKTENLIKWFDNREITCNDLRLSDVGSNVQLIGWFPNLNINSKFQQLKDGYGVTQIIVDKAELVEILKTAKNDSVVVVKGKVVARPSLNINSKLETGDIEVYVDKIKILDPNEPYDGPIKTKNLKLTSDSEDSNQNINESGRLLTKENIKETIIADINKFTYRTHNCGELTLSNCSQNVIVCGWLEFQRMKKFIILRDGYGQIQCMIPENLSDKITQMPLESILKIEGIVKPRPDNMKNPSMKTGDIEIHVTSVEILNEASRNLPMDVRDFHRAKEVLRMEHRYIDLRFSDMQRNLRMRSTFFMKIREYLINYLGFVEVETPTLFRRTPGGAQEFVVPTRKPGHFYSLVQSPQQFKQMLMAGAIDRYFQIARCYRDEATRPDRQPEFTQLDIELSFTDRDKILTLIEETLNYCWPNELKKFEIPFPRMAYDEAMSKYGSDKPDTRFELTLKDVTTVVNKFSEADDFGACAIIVKKPNSIYPTSLKKIVENIVKDFKCKFVGKRITEEPSDWAKVGIGKLLPPECTQELVSALDIEKDDLLFLAFGDKRQSQTLLGRIRLAMIEYLEEHDHVPKRKNDQYNFLWILDFPMFTKNENDKEQIESTHHPFTACHPDDLEKLKTKNNLFSIKSQAYDLVLNGQEIGGGSIRIHDCNLQKFILDEILNIEYSHLKHLLDALKSGCPPHGGIALGLDRLMSIICETKSIRDVIAFPKGLNGKDHLSKAPVPISNDELKLYHLYDSTKVKTENEKDQSS